MNSGAEAVETARQGGAQVGLRGQGRAGGPGRDHRLRQQFPRPHARHRRLLDRPGRARRLRAVRAGLRGRAVRRLPTRSRRRSTPNTVAFLVEPIQGEAGVDHSAGRLFHDRCASSARERNVTLILDEIQTGLGRTGKLLAEEHEGIEADVTLIGKALSGGFYPVSAVLSNSEVLGVLKPGQHGCTFGGNPLACAVARAALKVLVEEGMIENAEQQGARFMAQLRGDPQQPRSARCAAAA